MQNTTVVFVGGELTDAVLPHLVTDDSIGTRTRCFSGMGQDMWAGQISMRRDSGISTNVYIVRVEDRSDAAMLDADYLIVDAEWPVKERRMNIVLPPEGKKLPACQLIELHKGAAYNAQSVAHALAAIILRHGVTLVQPEARQPRPWVRRRRERIA